MTESGYLITLWLQVIQAEFGPLLGLPDDDVAGEYSFAFACQMRTFLVGCLGLPEAFYGKLNDDSRSGYAIHQILSSVKQVFGQ